MKRTDERRAYEREYRARTKDSEKGKARAEYNRAYHKAWYARQKDSDEFKAKEAARNRVYRKEWYARNREREKAAALARYYAKHDEKKAAARLSRRRNAAQRAEYGREYRKTHERKTSAATREKARQHVREKRLEIRLQAILKMGGCCETCGISDERVLQFDHRIPLRRNSKISHCSSVSHRQILEMENPSQVFALLCANCHITKTRLNGEYSGSYWGGRRKLRKSV